MRAIDRLPPPPDAIVEYHRVPSELIEPLDLRAQREITAEIKASTSDEHVRVSCVESVGERPV